jgi:hypothetical protein
MGVSWRLQRSPWIGLPSAMVEAHHVIREEPYHSNSYVDFLSFLPLFCL